MDLKAWKVADNEEGYGIIVFAETRGKARQLAIGEVEIMMDYEWCDLSVTREPRADKYSDNEPSYLEFCENAGVYKNLGWYCHSRFDCNSPDCVFFSDNLEI